MDLEFYEGNIIDAAADAIVLPANTRLKEGSGASAAIFHAAGAKELASACKQIGRCDVGKAVPTPAFHLKNTKFIIHAVVPKWIDGSHNEYDLLCSAYLSSLYLADMMNCSSIAFPLLASGNNKFDLKLATEIAVKSINQFEGNNLKHAVIILFGDNTTGFVQSLGYDVLKLSESKTTSPNWNEIANEGKEVLDDFLKNQAQKALVWLKDEDHQQLIMDRALKIVRLLVTH